MSARVLDVRAGSDLWYDSSFDERWRMVATYRSTDANPKERFVHHHAGAGGDGRNSYIDLVVFRERDTDGVWTDASDGTLEERLYYCQNQHADVVALVTDAGAQRVMARYSAYGVPIGLPVGDTSSEGDVDLTDRDTLWDNYTGIALSRTELSAVGNVRGCAGYRAAGFDLTVYLIRNRVFPSARGVWASTDSLGRVDEMSQFEYTRSSPVLFADPDGRRVLIKDSSELVRKVDRSLREMKRMTSGERTYESFLGSERLGAVGEMKDCEPRAPDHQPCFTHIRGTTKCTTHDFGGDSVEKCTKYYACESIVCVQDGFPWIDDPLLHELAHAQWHLGPKGLPRSERDGKLSHLFALRVVPEHARELDRGVALVLGPNYQQ